MQYQICTDFDFNEKSSTVQLQCVKKKLFVSVKQINKKLTSNGLTIKDNKKIILGKDNRTH